MNVLRAQLVSSSQSLLVEHLVLDDPCRLQLVIHSSAPFENALTFSDFP